MPIKKPLISSRNLSEKMDDPYLMIIDTRFSLFDSDLGYNLYKKSHIPGAIYAHLDKDLAGSITSSSGRHPLPDIENICSKLKIWGINNSSHIVVYDDNNSAFAARLWWMFKWLGHSNVTVLNGGFDDWCKNKYPINSDIPIYKKGNFECKISNDITWSSEKIMNWMSSSQDFVLVDARDSNRYKGIEEPIDNVAGHIPGSINIPFTEFLRNNGSWKDKNEIISIWRRNNISTLKEWGVMCGSGVTACHLLISAEIANINPPKLYPGSWSEWISDKSRPITNER